MLLLPVLLFWLKKGFMVYVMLKLNPIKTKKDSIPLFSFGESSTINYIRDASITVLLLVTVLMMPYATHIWSIDLSVSMFDYMFLLCCVVLYLCSCLMCRNFMSDQKNFSVVYTIFC